MEDKKKNQVKIVNLHGSTMMSVDKMSRKGDDLVMSGNVMGTMPGTFYVTPGNLWKMVKLLNGAIIMGLPAMLIKGFFAYRKNQQKP